MQRSWLVLALAAVLALPAAGCSPSGGSSSERAPDVGGPFTLTNQNGARVDQSLLKGKWTAVFFGYTFCPDVCPATLTTLAQAIERMGPDGQRLQVVFVSVDPERDTPAQLKTYLSSPSFPKATIGLTGTPAQVSAVARAYHVYYKKAGGGADYSVDHTSILYLMDPQGHFSRPIGFGAAPADMAKQISEAMRGG